MPKNVWNVLTAENECVQKKVMVSATQPSALPHSTFVKPRYCIKQVLLDKALAGIVRDQTIDDKFMYLPKYYFYNRLRLLIEKFGYFKIEPTNPDLLKVPKVFKATMKSNIL